jgi:anhydro-N-acetylmuramic acid kinase
MSGTLLDGVDAALVDTEGQGVAISGPVLMLPYNAKTRAILGAAISDAKDMAQRRRCLMRSAMPSGRS